MNEFSYINLIEIIRIIFLGLLWFISVSRIIKEENEVRKIKREKEERKKEE